MSEYMTAEERRRFRDGRTAGAISFFRTSECKLCRGEVYIGALFCSKKCYELAKEMGMGEKTFVEVIKDYLHRQITIETRDGMYLSGLLTSVEAQVVHINQDAVTIPVSLKLDNDSEKVVELGRIYRVTTE